MNKSRAEYLVNLGEYLRLPDGLMQGLTVPRKCPAGKRGKHTWGWAWGRYLNALHRLGIEEAAMCQQCHLVRTEVRQPPTSLGTYRLWWDEDEWAAWISGVRAVA